MTRVPAPFTLGAVHLTTDARPSMGGLRPRVIVDAHRGWLIARCGGGDFTLRGLVAELAQRGLKADFRTV